MISCSPILRAINTIHATTELDYLLVFRDASRVLSLKPMVFRYMGSTLDPSLSIPFFLLSSNFSFISSQTNERQNQDPGTIEHNASSHEKYSKRQLIADCFNTKSSFSD